MCVGWNSLDVINNTNFARKMEKDADWNKQSKKYYTILHWVILMCLECAIELNLIGKIMYFKAYGSQYLPTDKENRGQINQKVNDGEGGSQGQIVRTDRQTFKYKDKSVLLMSE